LNCKQRIVVFFVLNILFFLSFPILLWSESNLEFKSDFYVFSEKPGMMQILIIVYVPYDQLSFKVVDSLYTAEVDISAILYKDGKQKGGDLWRRSISLREYEKTKSYKQGMKWSFSMPAQPEEFELHIKVEDVNSKKAGEKIEKHELESLQGRHLWVNQPIFFRKEENGGKEWLMSNNLDVESNSIFALVSVVSDTASGEDYLLRTKIIDFKGTEAFKVNIYVKLDSLVNSRTIVLPLKKLEEKEYKIKVQLIKDGKIVSESTKSSQIVFPFFLSKRYDIRVEQMTYIASDTELKKLKETAKEEREKVWNEFWTQKDPIPETPVNETSEEYFRRIDYANTHFRSFQSGWRTDRGKIYIIYGKPDEIEHHHFELETPPYQIWYYYNFGRKFVFIDHSMTGDYTLIRR